MTSPVESCTKALSTRTPILIPIEKLVGRNVKVIK